MAGGATLGFLDFHPSLMKPPQTSEFTSPEMKAEVFELHKGEHCVTFSPSNEFVVSHSWKAQSLVAFLATVLF